MTLNPFSWVRALSRAAFLNGIADGMAAIADDCGAPPPDLAALQERLRAAGALPALPDRPAAEPAGEEPSAEPTTTRKRK